MGKGKGHNESNRSNHRALTLKSPPDLVRTYNSHWERKYYRASDVSSDDDGGGIAEGTHVGE